MTLKGEEFEATDVSQGFITNDIRRLYPIKDQPALIDVETPSGQIWRGNIQRGWTPSPRKLETDPRSPERIVTVRGAGYMLADV